VNFFFSGLESHFRLPVPVEVGAFLPVSETCVVDLVVPVLIFVFEILIFRHLAFPLKPGVILHTPRDYFPFLRVLSPFLGSCFSPLRPFPYALLEVGNYNFIVPAVLWR